MTHAIIGNAANDKAAVAEILAQGCSWIRVLGMERMQEPIRLWKDWFRNERWENAHCVSCFLGDSFRTHSESPSCVSQVRQPRVRKSPPSLSRNTGRQSPRHADQGAAGDLRQKWKEQPESREALGARFQKKDGYAVCQELPDYKSTWQGNPVYQPARVCETKKSEYRPPQYVEAWIGKNMQGLF